LKSDHIRIEERSIALHEAIAQRLREKPELLELARENLDRWIEMSGETPAWRSWKRILGEPLDAIIQLLVSPDERSRELRQSSPFCGILSQKERWRIYETFSPGTYYQSGR
jgi:hypothetical protein